MSRLLFAALAALALTAAPAAADLPRHMTGQDGDMRTAQTIVPGYRCPSNKLVSRAIEQLPERYLYIPSQFWRHKNHATVLEAMTSLRRSHPDMTLVMSGALLDSRHPKHPARILRTIERFGLEGVPVSIDFVNR